MPRFRGFNRGGPDLLSILEVDGGADDRRGVDYRASDLLENAVNTALALGRPLLVSGEPGCGKTELGFCIARKLGIGRVHFFAVKSDSEAQRLFYEHDTIRRFHVAQIGAKKSAKLPHVDPTDPRLFIRYQALGQAILDASAAEDVHDLLPPNRALPVQPQRSVVVVDEIDKAPRDFPNDLLNEIDQMWFRVPELAGWIDRPETPRGKIAPELRPIVVITSNLERQLPDAFLRRCVFHNIAHPDADDMRNIVISHLRRDAIRLADEDLRQAITLVKWARGQGLDKRPGLAELIEFARALGLRNEDMQRLTPRQRLDACLAALAKTTHDLQILRERPEAATAKA